MNRPHTFSCLAVRAALVIIAVTGVAAAGYVLAIVPPTGNTWYPKCMLHATTGLHCPGCGTTRAAHFALNGQLLTAAQFNIVAVIALPISLVALARSSIRWALDRPNPDRRPMRAFWLWLLVAALISFAVVRNIPTEPFSRLAPKELDELTTGEKP